MKFILVECFNRIHDIKNWLSKNNANNFAFVLLNYFSQKISDKSTFIK